MFHNNPVSTDGGGEDTGASGSVFFVWFLDHIKLPECKQIATRSTKTCVTTDNV